MITTVIVLIGGGVALIIGWFSFQSLLQGRLLSRWRHPSIANLDGRWAALYGEVRVVDPLHVRSVGACLWYREIITLHGNESTKTESDEVKMAGLMLVVEGREFGIREFPTEVYGGETSTRRDDWSAATLLLGGSRTIREKWLPVVDHLTVVGRVRQERNRWHIEKDPVAGLLFTAHHPARTAMKEYVKGALGLAGAAAIVGATVWVVKLFG